MAIKMSPEEVRSSGAKYLSSSDQIQDILSNLNVEQNKMTEAWEGDAFNSFDERYQELAPKIQEFGELIKEIGTQINSAAQIMQDTDSEIARAVRG